MSREFVVVGILEWDRLGQRRRGGGGRRVLLGQLACEDDFARADDDDYIKRLLLMLLLFMPGVLYCARYTILCSPYIAYALMRMLYECYAGVRAAGYAML